ncbi:MAG: DMT family transporter [Pseudomonadota bacterium]
MMAQRAGGGVLLAVVLTTLAILAFAGNSLLTRAALADGHLGPATFAGLRLLSGAITLAAIGLWGAHPVRPGRADLPGIAALAVYAVAFTFAYVNMGAAAGALILFAMVQLTMAAVATLQGQRPRGLEAIGLLVALGGLAWLLAPGLTAPPLLPALLMAIAGAAWGAYTLFGRGASDPLAATARNFIGTWPLAVVLLAGLAFEAPSVRGVVLAVLSGAITSGLGYAIWYAVLPRLTVAIAGCAQLTVPAVAAIGGALWLGETITLRLALASLLILAGVGLTILGRRQT